MDDLILLDTTVATAIWDLNHPAHSNFYARVSAFGESIVRISVVTVGEALYGLAVSPAAAPERHEAVKAAMSAYAAWPIDHHVAEVYAELRGRLFVRHSPRDVRGRLTKKQPEELIDQTTAKALGIQENDLWIISVAVTYNLRFITCDDSLSRILELATEHMDYTRAEIWSWPRT